MTQIRSSIRQLAPLSMCVFTIVLGLSLPSGGDTEASRQESNVIATGPGWEIKGIPLLTKEGEASLRQRLALPGMSGPQLRDRVKRVQFTSLQMVIEGKVIEHALRKHNVQVTGNEVEDHAKLLIAQAEAAPETKKVLWHLRASRRLVTLLARDKTEAEAAYREHFRGMLQERDWKRLQERFAAVGAKALDEELAFMERAVPMSMEAARERAAYDLPRIKLVEKLKQSGEIREGEDYLDWLYRQLQEVKILRADFVLFDESEVQKILSSQKREVKGRLEQK